MKPPAPVPGIAGSLMKTTSPLILAYLCLRQPGTALTLAVGVPGTGGNTWFSTGENSERTVTAFESPT